MSQDVSIPPASAAPTTDERARPHPARVAVWAALVLAFFGFLIVGRVPVHDQQPQTPPHSERILTLWLDQARRLPAVAHPELLRVLFFVALLLVVGGAALALWVALMTPPPVEAEPVADQSPSVIQPDGIADTPDDGERA